MSEPIVSTDIRRDFDAYVRAARSRYFEAEGIEPRHTAKASIEFSSGVTREDVDSIVWEELKDKSDEFNLWFEDVSPSESTSFGSSIYDSTKIVWRYFIEIYPSGYGYVTVDAVSDSGGVALIVEEIQDRLNGLLDNRPENLLTLRAYWMGRHGPEGILSDVLCPSWSEIRDNYPAKTGSEFEVVVQKIKERDQSGKLIIWHGPPGTGKSWAIRSLMMETKNTHIPVAITDADAFMEDSSYYYNVVNSFKRPCLFILEDAAEGILKESRRVHGNRIAKILNLTDGLVAQGRGDLFLITFNEDIDEIDPAVARPGRCMGTIEFSEFGRNEAIKWLRNKGFDGEIPNRLSFTLADLFGILRGDRPSTYQ